MQFKRGPVMEPPREGDEYDADKLVNEYGWIRVAIANEDIRFPAAYWVSNNCGEEYMDYIYEPRNKWIFRNHEAAAMFKLIYG